MELPVELQNVLSRRQVYVLLAEVQERFKSMTLESIEDFMDRLEVVVSDMVETLEVSQPDSLESTGVTT